MKFYSRPKMIEAIRWIGHATLRAADSPLNQILRAEDIPEDARPDVEHECLICEQALC